jgi:hypothetical protein
MEEPNVSGLASEIEEKETTVTGRNREENESAMKECGVRVAEWDRRTWGNSFEKFVKRKREDDVLWEEESAKRTKVQLDIVLRMGMGCGFGCGH